MVGLRERRGRIDHDRAVHPVRDVSEDRLRAAVVHVHARVVRAELEGERLARRDILEGDVRRDHLPSRTCTMGPGAPWPSNAQVLYFTPGAISTTMSFRVICTFTSSLAGTGGNTALVAWCAIASSSAFSPVLPAKLSSGRLVRELEPARL